MRISSFWVLEYAGLLGRACPAAVYEYTDAEGADQDAAGKKFVINSQVSPFAPPLIAWYDEADVELVELHSRELRSHHQPKAHFPSTH